MSRKESSELMPKKNWNEFSKNRLDKNASIKTATFKKAKTTNTLSHLG